MDPPGEVRPPAAADFLAAFRAGARRVPAFLVGARFLAFLAGARLTAFLTAFLVGARFLAAFLCEARRFAATAIARPSELTWRRLSFDDGRTASERYLSRSSMTGMSPQPLASHSELFPQLQIGQYSDLVKLRATKCRLGLCLAVGLSEPVNPEPVSVASRTPLP